MPVSSVMKRVMSCLTCDDNADCHGLGTCVANECVECTVNADCDNGLNCDGVETCDAGVCLPGPAPCGADFCTEEDGCVQCNIDDDCYGLGVCEGNVCVECRHGRDCSNRLWCDGGERCVNNQCLPGSIRCSGEFCNETTNECLMCDADEDCHGLGECVDTVCVECTENSDCDNGRYCDGPESCDLSSGVCVPGDIPCSGEFCNETGASCLTCDGDADCHGLGECVANECVECTENSDCLNGLWCDGWERCTDEGVCEAGTPRCAGAFCNETANSCYECNIDTDCFGGGRCINNVCFECRYDSDCNNDLFCDGEETCNADLGVCELGDIPCAGDYCNETEDTCLTCLEDADCSGGGVCVENACFECRDNAGCDNGLYCDGEETCNADGECVLGPIPCGGDYCDEAADGAECLACLADADCFGGGRCINNGCFECRLEADCNNNLFCDGLERCEDNVCVLGEIPCAGKFCDESVNTCLTCLGDNDCFGGMCVDNVCVECTVDGDCNNGQFCDGVETCNAGACRAGTAPCVGQTCDETDDMCLPCVADSDCGEFFSCENAMCVAYPIASPVTTASLKGPGVLEIIYYPNRIDIALITLMQTTEKSIVTITSELKDFPVYLNGLAVNGSLKSLKGKNVILNGPLTATGGIDKIQIQGAEPGCSIEAPWIDTVSIAGDFSCDMMLTGAGSPKNWLTLRKLSIKGRLSDSELLITGDVGSANVGFWGAGGTLAVGAEAGLDGELFTNDDVATEGELGNFKFNEYETLNNGEAFGIIANEFKNPKTLLPFDDGDFHIRQVQ